jgi:glycosyltransferase involved in cell wall biosynthesis
MKSKKIDILHVYYGSSGIAGTYVDEIYNSLKNEFRQECIVNYYFPFNYGLKKYFKITELGHLSSFLKHKKIRLSIRFLELILTSFYIFYYCKRHKVKVLNYSIVADSNIEKILINKIIKSTKTKVAITCHDVKPFSLYNTSSQAIEKKKVFFELADFLIVHNSNSVSNLSKYYGIDTSKTILYPFPLMDSQNVVPLEDISKADNLKTYCIIGHLRNEKGLDVLLNARKKFYTPDKDTKLIVAGNIPSNASINIQNPSKLNIEFRPGFVSDNEYSRILEIADYIILPYKHGTNTGIPSSAILKNTNVISSDIEMFKNMNYLDKNLMFESENVDELVTYSSLYQ